MRNYRLLPDHPNDPNQYPWPIDPIWETPAIKQYERNCNYFFDSPRCGGPYSATDEAICSIGTIRSKRHNHAKAKLTSWLIEQRRLGNKCPMITMEVVDRAEYNSKLSIPDRADAILTFIASKTPKLGQGVIYASRDPIEEVKEIERSRSSSSDGQMFSFFVSDASRRANYYNLIAFSESIDFDELNFLLKYLKERKWIEIRDIQDNTTNENRIVVDGSGSRFESYTKSCLLTVEGYARLADIQKIKTESSRGFMAMWFDQSMNEAWEKGFEPGIRKAGYDPVRIDQKQHVNKIDDEIIAEIRRARFIVADFTQDESGARGGVYYEAGFAHGLGIPVIFTCREDCLKEIHFDIRQYNCILWKDKDLEKLQKDLTNRIRAILEDGPGRVAG